MRAWTAGGLSTLWPGLGQAFNREWGKALTLGGAAAIITLGTSVPALSFYLWVVLFALWLSAIIDAYKTAQAGSAGQWYYAKSYVITMLLMTGPIALPLLWKSPEFARTPRIVWTVLVLGIAGLLVPIAMLLEYSTDIFLNQPNTRAILESCGINPYRSDTTQVLRELIQCLQ